jgi:hypothetical protein
MNKNKLASSKSCAPRESATVRPGEISETTNEEFRRIDPFSAGAYVVQKEDFRISFNPDTSQGMFGDSDGGPETALVFENMPCGKDGHTWTGDRFYLLKGDFRPEYAAALQEFGDYRWTIKTEVFDKFRDAHGSRWSSDFNEWGKDGILRPLARTEERTAKPDAEGSAKP